MENLPVGPEYLLGPGDELVVSIWGKISGEHILRVDREGKVNFPVLGLLQISGLTFSEAKDYLERRGVPVRGVFPGAGGGGSPQAGGAGHPGGVA